MKSNTPNKGLSLLLFLSLSTSAVTPMTAHAASEDGATYISQTPTEEATEEAGGEGAEAGGEGAEAGGEAGASYGSEAGGATATEEATEEAGGEGAEAGGEAGASYGGEAGGATATEEATEEAGGELGGETGTPTP